MRHPLLLAMLTTLAVARPTAAQAPAAHDARDLREDRADLGRDRAEVADDVRDLRRIEVLQGRWDAARGRRDAAALDRLEDAISRVLGSEIRETQADLAHDAGSANRDAAKLAEDRRLAEQGRPGLARREGREDAASLRQERGNARRDRAVLDRLIAIDRDFTPLRGRRDKAAMERKQHLIGQLVGLARSELQHDAANQRVDQGKARRDAQELQRERR